MKAELHTPWSDVIALLSFADNQDAEGYGVEAPVRREIFCTWEDGVSQKEFYLSQKEGLQASAMRSSTGSATVYSEASRARSTA